MTKQIFLSVLVTLSFLFSANNVQAQCQPNAGEDYSTSCWQFQLNGVLSSSNSTCKWTCIGSAVIFDNDTNAITSLLCNGYGTYQFVLTETNGNCVNSDTVEIVYYQFYPDSGNDTTLCDTIYQMDADPTYPGFWTYNDSRVFISDANDPNAIIGYNANTITWPQSGTFSTTFHWISSDNGGCQDYSDVVIITFSQCLNNINTLNKSKILKIYPNPAHNNIKLLIGNPQYGEIIKILNIDGKLVKQLRIQQSESIINISDLENGVYFIKTGDSIHKFIKE